MRSSQLANTASPEIQERFKRAKKLLLKLNAMSGYEEECRSAFSAEKTLFFPLFHDACRSTIHPSRPPPVGRLPAVRPFRGAYGLFLYSGGLERLRLDSASAPADGPVVRPPARREARRFGVFSVRMDMRSRVFRHFPVVDQ